ncbi:AraC family transcriptional regulator [Alicyclobacillus fastidiosus]|uniref:AraC family transcriptional regulator n=1 Tax=Alicyclobacillus fastidiosus TaxID=392011 RepID=A0ABY6ZKM2_9BACL|nr:helix-turn-helix domain-containing protein [Alicyclobacillus fastidiosus]WAH43143.1 AraC family transcriptional regulator [Alicyclobacillus fastidiosus]GMA65156.1 DNA-binding transcriptional regulator AraC [Alicyclobacillus fastidiosus]
MADFLYDPAEELTGPNHLGVLADHFRKSSNYSVRRSKGTQDYLLTFTMAGQGGFKIDDKIETCVCGDISILSPGTPHHYGTLGQIWEFYWVHFVPRADWLIWIQQMGAHSGFTQSSIADVSVQSRLRGVFRRMIRDSRALGSHQHALAMNAVEEMLIVLALSLQQSNMGLDPRVEEVLQLMSQRFSEGISVDMLAKQVGLSASRLSHIFKQQVGESIIECLIKLRLRHASRLLERTTEQISEISDLCGFQSPYYFTRKFREHYGMSPTQYRNNMLQDNV